MLPYFLKRVENSLEFSLDDKELTFVIPAFYFDRKYAVKNCGIITIFGIFRYYITDTKTGKMSKPYTFQYPTMFDTAPSSTVSLKNHDMFGIKDDYVLLKYVKGDTVVVSTKLVQSVVNSEIFHSMFTGGKIPSSIPYDDLQNYFTYNLKLNGKEYGLNMQLFGLLIGELASVKGNPNRLFRHSSMEDMTNYEIKNIKSSPKYVSPFSAYTSEVYDEAIINASMVKQTATSPLEKLFMGYE